MINRQLITKLANGIDALHLKISPRDQQRLISYCYLLQKWNRHFNLTAITNLEKMITHHLLDSLAMMPYVHGKRLLDVGSGAGLPGIPLAVAFPDIKVVLLDKNVKKTRFLLQAVAELEIKNVEVVHSRVENFHQPCFDAIIFRAVGAANHLIASAQHLCCENGQFLLMKGGDFQQELTNLPYSQVISITVPGLNAQRNLVIIEKQQIK